MAQPKAKEVDTAPFVDNGQDVTGHVTGYKKCSVAGSLHLLFAHCVLLFYIICGFGLRAAANLRPCAAAAAFRAARSKATSSMWNA